MTSVRSSLSRPPRSAIEVKRPARRRLPLLAALVAGISACTAVAADRLPGDDATERVAAAAQPDEPDPAENGPVDGAVSTMAPSVAADATPPPASPSTEDGPTTRADETGTIVAQAVTDTVVARERPTDDAPVVADLANPTDRGGPLVFQAIGRPEGDWLQVLLPVRPNGTSGWIRLDEVELSRNPYRITVDLEAYEITVERDGEVEISAPVAIGEGGTPTPVGDFYLIELLQPPAPDGPYGTYAYGLSGYSDVLDRFNGGDGVIGIHGTNEPELLGGPASHGCIRVHNDTISLMAEILPLGTPVSIHEGDAAPGGSPSEATVTVG